MKNLVKKVKQKSLINYIYHTIIEYKKWKVNPYQLSAIHKLSKDISQGTFVELATGSGKTLAIAVLCIYKAFSGEVINVVTCNEYLAQRDAEFCAEITNLFNIKEVKKIYPNQVQVEGREYLRVDYIVPKTPFKNKISIYDRCNIIYHSTNQIVFDYLHNLQNKLPSNFLNISFTNVVIDECDLILLDEGLTPNILSFRGNKQNTVDFPKVYRDIKYIFKYLDLFVNGIDFILKDLPNNQKTVELTDTGYFKMSEIFNVSWNCEQSGMIFNHLKCLLEVKYSYQLNRHYIIQNKQILLIDEESGRIQENKKLEYDMNIALYVINGLPLSIDTTREIKIIQRNFFKMFDKIYGLSGTLRGVEKELKVIFDGIIHFCKSKPATRILDTSLVALDIPDQLNLILERIKLIKEHSKGTPILIVCPTVKETRLISVLLSSYNYHNYVLNATTQQSEVTIFQKAGELDRITICTNIVGRGIDIKIGGEPFISDTPEEKRRKEIDAIYIKSIGGIYLIKTCLYQNERINNQVIGRIARNEMPGKYCEIINISSELYNGVPNITPLRYSFTDRYENNQQDREKYLRKLIKISPKIIKIIKEGLVTISNKTQLEKLQSVNPLMDIFYYQVNRIIGIKKHIISGNFKPVLDFLSNVDYSSIEPSLLKKYQKDVLKIARYSSKGSTFWCLVYECLTEVIIKTNEALLDIEFNCMFESLFNKNINILMEDQVMKELSKNTTIQINAALKKYYVFGGLLKA